ncbi:MAG: hypothetical protein AAB731_02295, partial [Patescibacteria group bacterium]
MFNKNIAQFYERIKRRVKNPIARVFVFEKKHKSKLMKNKFSQRATLSRSLLLRGSEAEEKQNNVILGRTERDPGIQKKIMMASPVKPGNAQSEDRDLGNTFHGRGFLLSREKIKNVIKFLTSGHAGSPRENPGPPPRRIGGEETTTSPPFKGGVGGGLEISRNPSSPPLDEGRKFNIFKNKRLHYGTAAVLFVAAFFAVLWGGDRVLGATFTFFQTSWAGGESLTAASHANGDRTGWTYFASSTNVTAGTSVTLSSSAGFLFTDDGRTSTSTNSAYAAGGLFASGAVSNAVVQGGATFDADIKLATSTQTNADSWTTLTAVAGAGAVHYGGAMLRNNNEDYIYVVKGKGTAYFQRYSISGNTWTTLTDVPGAVNNSGGLAFRNGAEDYIYVLQGN